MRHELALGLPRLVNRAQVLGRIGLDLRLAHRAAQADESAGNDRPAGVVCASERTATQRVPTEGQYGYVQRTGWHPAVSKMAAVDSIADGTPLTAHASADHDVTIYTATPTTAEILRRVGAAAGASEDGTSGTYNEDTVPMNLQIPAWTSARS